MSEYIGAIFDGVDEALYWLKRIQKVASQLNEGLNLQPTFARNAATNHIKTTPEKPPMKNVTAKKIPKARVIPRSSRDPIDAEYVVVE